ncbi:hypothetical protein K431DRAFT_200316, partial [Polychaeton citri CBS 116435]
SSHNPNSLPPAVAALLSVTEIPRPKANQFRRRHVQHRRISIDELVNEWKADESLRPSYGASPSLSVLLEDASDYEDESSLPDQSSSISDEGYLHTRSRSSESVPGLDADASSITSAPGPSTPSSLNSRRSTTNLRKEKQRSLPSSVDQSHDHPLLPARSLAQEDDADMADGLTFLTPSTSRSSTPKPKTSFKSNLTASLQSLKARAMSSISSLTLGSPTAQSQLSPSAPWSDEMLWSHPFLFPRFSSEIRPSFQGTPTEAQRRYLNPSAPLIFEEQEAPFQQALHAPYLAEHLQSSDAAPTIQLQTYNRHGGGRRKSGSSGGGGRGRSGGPSMSEAGRANSPASRQREPRENSDFLRVVVLEMNMRRQGKLEMGRAKIWLPPRNEGGVQPVAVAGGSGREVPRRWRG